MLYERKHKIKEKYGSSDEKQGEIHFTCLCSLSDFFLDPSLAFYQLKVPRWVIQLPATWPVSQSPDSKGRCCHDLEGEVSVSPLGGTVQSSGKILGVFTHPCTSCLILSHFISNNV